MHLWLFVYVRIVYSFYLRLMTSCLRRWLSEAIYLAINWPYLAETTAVYVRIFWFWWFHIRTNIHDVNSTSSDILSYRVIFTVSFIRCYPKSPFSLIAKPLFRTIRVSECVVVKFITWMYRYEIYRGFALVFMKGALSLFLVWCLIDSKQKIVVSSDNKTDGNAPKLNLICQTSSRKWMEKSFLLDNAKGLIYQLKSREFFVENV